MPPKLTRWEDPLGSTAGHWMVHGLPGLVLVQRPGQTSWRLNVVQDDSARWMITKYKTSWPHADTRAAHALLERHPQLRRRYRTRRQALTALEAVLQQQSESALGQALG